MFSTTVTPRFGDIDGLRHVNNTMLPVWFEQARNPLFRFFNPDMDFEKWNLIMARIEVDFLSQMRFGTDVEIRSWVSRIGNSSFEVLQEAWQNGVCAARGRAVIVHFDFAAQKAVRIPETVRMSLSAHLLPDED
jgi:acyl-CoA thioester hydrolase